MDVKVSLVGNPNVGKSSIFNALTGLKQHTGNWSGKTVGSASGSYVFKNNKYDIYDLPGTYSLIANSKEEEISRDFIYNNKDNITVIVVDSTMLEKGLNLVLQILEVSNKSILCLNLIDEAKKKEIDIDIQRLSNILKIPVIGTSAKNKVGLDELREEIYKLTYSQNQNSFKVKYDDEIEDIIANISNEIRIDNRSFIIKSLVNENLTNNQFSVLF